MAYEKPPSDFDAHLLKITPGDRPLFCRIIGPEKPDFSKYEDREWERQKHWAEGLIVKILSDSNRPENDPEVLVCGVLPMQQHELIPEPYNAWYGFSVPSAWLEPLTSAEIEAEGWQVYQHPQLGRQVLPMPDGKALSSFIKPHEFVEARLKERQGIKKR